MQFTTCKVKGFWRNIKMTKWWNAKIEITILLHFTIVFTILTIYFILYCLITEKRECFLHWLTAVGSKKMLLIVCIN